MSPFRPKILFIAGEASGDARGAELIEAIRRLAPEARCYGLGGDAMASAGMVLSHHITETAFLGFAEVLRHLPTIRRIFQDMKRLLDRDRPDVVVPIDYPGFNLRFAAEAKRRKIPVVYYIAPQVWAWGRWRLRKIRRVVDRMVVVFPFEETLYRQWGIPVTFVGHPLVDAFRIEADRVSFLSSLGIAPDRPVLGLFPGSRRQEVRRLLPEMIGAAEILSREIPGLVGIVGKAPTLSDSEYPLPGHILSLRGKTHTLMAACDAALVASGTATLEAAVAGTPMVVVYRMAPLTYWLGRSLVRLDRIGLVNIVSGRSLVPERIQDQARAKPLAEAVRPFLVDPETNRRVREDLRLVRERLGEPGAAIRAARIVLKAARGDG